MTRADLNSVNFDKTVFLKGSSMQPFLKTGDLITFEETDLTHLKPGDILVFKPKGKDYSVVHRLIKIQITERSTRIITKGDNNLDYDTTFSNSEIIGKAVELIRGTKLINLNSKATQFKNTIYKFFSVINLNLTFFKKKRSFRKS